jgi:hypothetical protein
MREESSSDGSPTPPGHLAYRSAPGHMGGVARRLFAARNRWMGSLLSPQSVVAGRLRDKAQYCRERESQLYAVLLEGAARDVLAGGACWHVLQGHERDPKGSALALRFLGSIHRLVLEGRSPELSEYYPSVGGRRAPSEALGPFLRAVNDHASAIRRMIDEPVQTNEVGRCAALLGGFLLVARETGLPLRLLEIGASAGLNLRWDSYRYVAPEASWGSLESAVVVDWELRSGWPPVGVSPSVVERRGCDVAPVDPRDREGRLRLMSYVWPNHLARFRVLEQALKSAAHLTTEVDRANGSDWLADQLRELRPGVATVVFHSIVMQFMTKAERRRVRQVILQAGLRATPQAPLAWLRMEGGAPIKDVLLTRWPAGRGRRIACAGLYGRPVYWLANDEPSA